MLALGIDPGIALTGYGFVKDGDVQDIEIVDFGVISTPPDMPIEKRLQEIYKGIHDLTRKYQPDSSGIEKLLFGRNVSTAMSVGQARGVTILAIADNQIPITEYTPAEIKQAVAGYGNADKRQVQEMVRLLLNLDEIPRPDDAADALAVAITHLHAARYQRLLDEG